MKQFTVLDGFNIVLALVILVIPFALNYKTEGSILHISMGISLLSNVFIKSMKIKIFIAVVCVSAIFYSHFQIK